MVGVNFMTSQAASRFLEKRNAAPRANDAQVWLSRSDDAVGAGSKARIVPPIVPHGTPTEDVQAANAKVAEGPKANAHFFAPKVIAKAVEAIKSHVAKASIETVGKKAEETPFWDHRDEDEVAPMTHASDKSIVAEASTSSKVAEDRSDFSEAQSATNLASVLHTPAQVAEAIHSAETTTNATHTNEKPNAGVKSDEKAHRADFHEDGFDRFEDHTNMIPAPTEDTTALSSLGKEAIADSASHETVHGSVSHEDAEHIFVDHTLGEGSLSRDFHKTVYLGEGSGTNHASSDADHEDFEEDDSLTQGEDQYDEGAHDGVHDAHDTGADHDVYDHDMDVDTTLDLGDDVSDDGDLEYSDDLDQFQDYDEDTGL